MTTNAIYEVGVISEGVTRILHLPNGANLRRALLDADLSPYTPLTSRFNCGGRGLCATCGVIFEAGEPSPRHWHDQVAAQYGYPRLSCQIVVEGAMTVRIMEDKVVWGRRDPGRKWRKSGSRE